MGIAGVGDAPERALCSGADFLGDAIIWTVRFSEAEPQAIDTLAVKIHPRETTRAVLIMVNSLSLVSGF
jgi:hypothetical protein